jgi:hypothetical protein
MSDGEFSVAEFYSDGLHAYVKRWIDAESAVKLAKRCTEKAAARQGWISRVIITDGGDCCVFEWQHDKGLTFPAAEDLKP